MEKEEIPLLEFIEEPDLNQEKFPIRLKVSIRELIKDFDKFNLNITSDGPTLDKEGK